MSAVHAAARTLWENPSVRRHGALRYINQESEPEYFVSAALALRPITRLFRCSARLVARPVIHHQDRRSSHRRPNPALWLGYSRPSLRDCFTAFPRKQRPRRPGRRLQETEMRPAGTAVLRRHSNSTSDIELKRASLPRLLHEIRHRFANALFFASPPLRT